MTSQTKKISYKSILDSLMSFLHQNDEIYGKDKTYSRKELNCVTPSIVISCMMLLCFKQKTPKLTRTQNLLCQANFNFTFFEYYADERKPNKELGSEWSHWNGEKKEVRKQVSVFLAKSGFDQKGIQNFASSFQDPKSLIKEFGIDLEIWDARFFELSFSFNCKDSLFNPGNHWNSINVCETLSTFPQNIFDLWQEYIDGIGRRKLARIFTFSERHLVKHKYHCREVLWGMISGLPRQSYAVKSAINAIYKIY
jgi:hypothetical protein